MYPFVLAFYRMRQSLNHQRLSHAKAGKHLLETGEANVLQVYPLWIVSLGKGGGWLSCISLKAVCSKGVVLLVVDTVVVRCGIRGLIWLIAQFIGMSFSILCSCNLPVSEQSLPWLLFQGFGCSCTEDNMLLFVLSIAHNCNVIILRRLGKKM